MDWHRSSDHDRKHRAPMPALGWTTILVWSQLMFRSLDLLLLQVNNIAGRDLRRTVENPGSNMQGRNEIE